MEKLLTWLNRADELDMREFVYVDETSVRSLYASMYDGILTGVERSHSKSRKFSLRPKEAASVEVGSSRGVQQSFDIDVQVWFKAVRSELRRRRLLKDANSIAAANFQVGDFFEIDIELATSAVQLAAIFTSLFVKFGDAAPSLLDINPQDGDNVRELSSFLSSMVGGQVAVEAKVARPGGEIPNVRLASSLSKDLFWQDPGRVVSEGRRLKVLCRVRRPGLVESWDYIPYARLLSELIPDFDAREIEGELRKAIQGHRNDPLILEEAPGFEGDNASTNDPVGATDPETSDVSDLETALRLSGLSSDGPRPADADTSPSRDSVTVESQKTLYFEVQVVALYW